MVRGSFICLFLGCILQEGFKKFGSFFSFFGGLGYWYYYLLGYTGFAILGLSSFLYELFPSIGYHYPWLWIPLTIILIGETTFLAYMGIKISMRYVLYTGLAKITFLIITSIYLIIYAGPRNSILPFTPIPIKNNLTTLFVAMMLGIATFDGLNSFVPVAEETKNLKKNIPLALAILAFILGFTLILSSYTQTIIFGVNNMFNYANYPDTGILIYENTWEELSPLYTLFS